MGVVFTRYCEEEFKHFNTYFRLEDRHRTNYSNLVSPLKYSVWENLPWVALVEIYRFLPCKDRFNLSLTCRAWSRAFSRPEVWRQAKFDFNGVNDWRVLRFPASLASGLSHLDIDCQCTGKTLDKMNKDSKSYMYNFLESLVNCNNGKLVTLKLINMDRISPWFGLTSKRDIPEVIEDLLSMQTNLQLLDLSTAGFNVNQGVEILSQLAYTSGSTLTVLRINEFFKIDDPICIAYQVEALTNLKELTLSDDCLSSNLLYALVYSKSLRHLNVFAQLWVDVTPPSSLAWEYLQRSRPDLEASYFIPYKLLGRLGDLKNILVPGIPLVALQFKWFDTCHLWKFICQYIATHFQNHLRRLDIILCQDLVWGDHLLDVIIESCTVLEEISITDRGENSSLFESIERSVRRALAQQPASRLRRFYLDGEEVNLNRSWGRRLVDWIIDITE